VIPCGIFFLRGADGGFHAVAVFEDSKEFPGAGHGGDLGDLHDDGGYDDDGWALYFVERKKDEGEMS